MHDALCTQAIVVYRVNNEVFCSDAESTAFKFPVSNAKVLDSEGNPLPSASLSSMSIHITRYQ